MNTLWPWERKHWASLKTEKERLAFERLSLKEKAEAVPPPQAASKAAKKASDKAPESNN